MRAPELTKLPADHNPATCRECIAAHRDMKQWLARLDRLCRCCGTHVPTDQVVYIVGPLDSRARRDEWRMCGSCWHAGHQVGETRDPQGAA